MVRDSALEFLVQGSAAKPYQVSFLGEGENLTASCSCPAGRNRRFCKHVAGLLAGQAAKVIQGADLLAELSIRFTVAWQISRTPGQKKRGKATWLYLAGWTYAHG